MRTRNRAGQDEEQEFDPEIERRARRLNGARRRARQVYRDILADQEPEAEMGDHAVPPERTLREMVFPNNQNLRPSGITLPEIAEDWEMKHSFIQILPRFSDMPGEDPQRHLQDFEMACGTVRAEGPLAEYIRLVSFPFSLQDGAREWLYTLPEGGVTTWAQLHQKFLEKYYPAARIQTMRKRITSIKMGTGETFYDYWGRFKQLLSKCPHHQIPPHDLVQSFMDGLRKNERIWVNAACGGSVMNKVPSEAFKLLGEMAEDNREDGGAEPTRTESSDIPAFENKLDKLCNTFEKFLSTMGAEKPRRAVKLCELCMASTHHTDQCPMILEEEVNTVGQNGDQGEQRRHDPHSQT